MQTIIKLEKKHRMMPLHLCIGDVKAGGKFSFLTEFVINEGLKYEIPTQHIKRF
jgi:hypothetical protein